MRDSMSVQISTMVAVEVIEHAEYFMKATPWIAGQTHRANLAPNDGQTHRANLASIKLIEQPLHPIQR